MDDADWRKVALEVAAGVEAVAEGMLPGTEGWEEITGIIAGLREELGAGPPEDPEAEMRTGSVFLAELLCLVWFGACVAIAGSGGGEEVASRTRSRSFCALACSARKAGWPCWVLFTDIAEARLRSYMETVGDSPGGEALTAIGGAAANSCLAALMDSEDIPAEGFKGNLRTALPGVLVEVTAEVIGLVRGTVGEYAGGGEVP